MPSPLHVPVAQIAQVAPHPNADSLDVAQVLGWQCVVGRGQFKEQDKVIYFPPDTVLTPPYSDFLGVTQYLHKGRIKATRLRGEPSFGLVIKATDDMQVGENVAARLPWVSKYEPPTREQQRGQGKFIANPDQLASDPLFPDYTHIQNLRHFPDLLGPDEWVVVTEKLHGTNSRIGIVDGQWMAGSHHVRRGEGDALYWSPRQHQGVEALLTWLSKYHRQVILFGEILGSDVQSLDYGYKGHEGYRAFDLMVDGRYLDFHGFKILCDVYDIPMVPVVTLSPFDFEHTRRLSNGLTHLLASHLREGIVVKPLIERHDPKIGRVILKYVSDDYLLAKHSDFAEV